MVLRQDIVFSLILGLSPCEAFASPFSYPPLVRGDEGGWIGLSAKETAQILYPAYLYKYL
jgi:hypothetical protein